MDNSAILLIHLGGLGDVCLSESLFLSFQKHFGQRLIGLGHKRFLELFNEYFLSVESVDSRKWIHLFSGGTDVPPWRRIIFIGKDRRGLLRKRWQKLSAEEFIFIDMYPEGAFGAGSRTDGTGPHFTGSKGLHLEMYQLEQLAPYGIEPSVKTISPKRSPRVILYPEIGFEKEKWHPDNFLALHRLLTAKGINAIVLEAPNLRLDVRGKVFFQDLKETREFFSEGGIFVSNDSGMAHLAAARGLLTITVFTGFDPVVWHPRGRNISLVHGRDILDPTSLEAVVLKAMDEFAG